ncbi:KIN14B-interacting protein At4g14310 [Magnolia sinica]|uniref:KIN14B-interacting protein At4g14310 n=1 Tax=Magnolia sinica TaxID=86752 RepID=UPI0026587C84|nr:KIN14B-interacting protein At4g14310 [Magnolia sinica]
MSSSVRRVKERGGGGGKIMALKPQKTLTENHPKENTGSCKKPYGKENPRTVSGARTPSMCQKPAVRPLPMQRIDKAAVSSSNGKDGESRFRWSTSSLPKGKNSNPSDFTRLLSDLRRDRQPRVSGSDRSAKTLVKASVAESEASDEGKSANGFRVLEKCPRKKPYLNPSSRGRDDENCKELGLNLKEMPIDAVRVLDDCNTNVYLISNMERIPEEDVNSISKNSEEMSSSDLNSKVSSGKELNGVRLLESLDDGMHLESNSEGLGEKCLNGSRIVESSRSAVYQGPSLKAVGEKSLNGFGALENPKELKAGECGKDVPVVNKYPSRLHEKLAYLEGKVKSIASDIKRTKEMLDLNNPDSSKLILLDIQDKISGIEKAMGHVVDDNKGKLGLSEIVENDKLQPKHAEKGQDGKMGSLKSSAKALNHEELEARLFPHHKLLRSRGSLGNSSGKDQTHLPLKSKGDSLSEDKPLSPIDENPIALEFLASLAGTENSKINGNDKFVQLECRAVQATDMDGSATSAAQGVPMNVGGGKSDEDVRLTTDEMFEDFDDQENRPAMIIQEEIEDNSVELLKEVGTKTSTGGWFVSEGESVLLAHDDGSCSFYDITNSEEKAEYKPPAGVSHDLWGDCWLIRAAGSDGCSGRYVVAASAGNTLDAGFCSWDFYTKDIRAFRVEDGKTTMFPSRTVLGPLPNNGMPRRNTLSTVLAPENKQWWYKPCGPLLVSTASCQKTVGIYDIRDGDLVMKWEVPRPVLTMDNSSPLQWRNKGKVVIAETEAISLWDVNSLNPLPLLSIASSCKKITALHVNNTDAELGGGVRQRVSSSEAEGNDGVFCTHETINILDFRLPSGVGLKITKHGMNSHSVFSRGDSVFLGSIGARSTAKDQPRSLVQHFSLRKGKLIGTYVLPESNAHFHHSSITQVWGNSNLVMATCGLGLFVFDTLKDDGPQSFSTDHGNAGEVREIIGPDDLYRPSFDYLGSRVLLISRDRPAQWRYLL